MFDCDDATVVGGLSYEVVTEELHDEGRVLVALLAEGVELCCKNGQHVFSLAMKQWIQQSLPAMASSKACLARWQAWSGALRIS